MLLVPGRCVEWLKIQRPTGDYQKEILQDFEMIEPFLPEKVDSILDIGCGMGGIDVFLKRKFPHAKLFLLDGDGDETFYGFKENCKPYNFRKRTLEFLEANGVVPDGWFDVGTKEVLKADLVVSLISWGFHYPLETYNVEGFCIADLRKGREEPRGKVIGEAPRYKRCAFVSSVRL